MSSKESIPLKDEDGPRVEPLEKEGELKGLPHDLGESGLPEALAAAIAATEAEAQAVVEERPAERPELGERYEVIDLLGQGGMGAVWKVRDRNINKTLAVKVLRPELAADRLAVKRFEQEVLAASYLTQANLVAVYGSGKTATECPYMVMDYLDGKNLAELLSTEVYLPAGRVMDLTGQICEALVHAHAKGVVHRDLKPSNIIVTKSDGGNDIVKIVDFGIAKIMPSVKAQTTQLTQTGELFGSPMYMSPEQCQGEVIDSRSDIYSLGCIMYELLSGKQAFAAENPIKVILKQLSEDPPPLPEEMIPPGLSTVVKHCLEKDPDARYWSTKEVLEDIQSIMSGGLPIKREEKTKLKLLTVESCFRRFGARAIDGMVVGMVAMIATVLASNFAAFYGMTSWPDRSLKSAETMHGMMWTVPMIFFGLGVIEEFFPLCLPLTLVLTCTLITLASTPQDPLALSRSVIATFLLGICFFVPMIFAWLYHAGFECSARRATLGKQMFGIKVTDIRGQSLSFARASARHFSKLLTLLGLTDFILYPSYLIREKRDGLQRPGVSDFLYRRPLHDRMCRAFVSEDPDRLDLIKRPLLAAFSASSITVLLCITAFVSAIIMMGIRHLPSLQTDQVIGRFIVLWSILFAGIYTYKKFSKK